MNMTTEFKLIVAGERDFDNYELLSHNLDQLANGQYADRAVSIVSGMARGADSLAIQFASEHDVQIYQFHANWKIYGKSAGYMRNCDMGKFSDGLLAFYSGSRCTRHMINYMVSINKPVTVINY